jgi:hypothetical protein
MLNEKTILDNISKICKAKNYQYDIKKIDTHSKFECKCINNHIFVTDYYNLVYRKSGCPSCAPNKKLTQDEAELIVIERCNILNYKSGAFTYIGSIKTKLDLMLKNIKKGKREKDSTKEVPAGGTERRQEGIKNAPKKGETSKVSSFSKINKSKEK